MFFTTGRDAFLGFLRNLTPQVLLLSMALVLSTKLDLNHWDLSNWAGTLPFASAIFLFFCAALANIMQYWDGSITSDKLLTENSRELKTKGVEGLAHFFQAAKFALKHSKTIFFEFAIFVGVTQVALFAVLFFSFTQARAIYSALHPSGECIAHQRSR